MILYWNEVALEANRISHTTGTDKGVLGPTLSSRALAIVHLAMYDVAAEIGGTFLPYITKPIGFPAPPAMASLDAAIAAAAQSTLSALFPSQKEFIYQKHRVEDLSPIGYPEGYEYGSRVARLILDDRKNDPSDSDDGYASPIGRWYHKKDPNNPAQPFNAPFYGARSKCFAVGTRYTLNSPQTLSSAKLNKAITQAKQKGIRPELNGTVPNSQIRTAEETLKGLYWAYDGAQKIGTPPRLYNQIIRNVAIARGNTNLQNAQLFALVNVAMADAAILAWDQKYIHNYWRPVVGIREWDLSMGYQGIQSTPFSTVCDPQWLPRGAPNTNNVGARDFTPPFPAYPSGHATFGAAAFHMTRLFYKGTAMVGNRTSDDLFKDLLNNDMSFVSDELNGEQVDCHGTQRPKHRRSFAGGLWDMIIENGWSRVFLGVHWSFDSFDVRNNGTPDLTKNIGGVPLGLNIAEDIYQASLQGNMNNGIVKSSVGPRI